MFYTNEIKNHKLGSYTDDKKLAKKLGFNIRVEDIEIADNGVVYEKGYVPEMPEKSYIELRLLEYPPIAEQLDMIYWDKINGTSIWQDKISAIKERYPKN